MTASQIAPFSNSANVVDEMFTEARIDLLNAKLIEQGISAIGRDGQRLRYQDDRTDRCSGHPRPWQPQLDHVHGPRRQPGAV